MQIINSFLLIPVILFVGCKKDVAHQSFKPKADNTVQIQKKNTAELRVNDGPQLFVISCGSGCAIRYTSKQITKQGSDIKVTFKVELYEDEALTDEHDETYIFSYSSALKLEKITREGEKGNFLNTQMPAAQQSFREFAEGLIKKNNTKAPVSASESSAFIYNKRTDPKSAVYKTIETSTVKGLQKYSCNQNKTRHIALPAKANVQLLLVPQDCGDFQYRYYLIAIKDKKVSGELYVEGEWYEPDNEEEKEIRTFSIDRDYNIKVNIKTPDSSIVENYMITDAGAFKKI